MTAKEMDQMDQEVMALVNERGKELVQEIATPVCGLARNDKADGNGERQTEDAAPEEIATAAAQPRNDVEAEAAETCAEENEREKVDGEAPLQEKDGKYYISKEEFAGLEAKAKKAIKIKNAVLVAVCVVLMGVLFLTFSRPELLPWLVRLGVISCSVVIGVCLERLVEVNR